MRKLIGADDVGELLDCSRRHVTNMDDNGRIPKSFKLGTLRRWDAAEIAGWISAGCPSRSQWERVRDEYLTIGASAE